MRLHLGGLSGLKCGIDAGPRYETASGAELLRRKYRQRRQTIFVMFDVKAEELCEAFRKMGFSAEVATAATLKLAEAGIKIRGNNSRFKTLSMGYPVRKGFLPRLKPGFLKRAVEAVTAKYFKEKKRG